MAAAPRRPTGQAPAARVVAPAAVVLAAAVLAACAAPPPAERNPAPPVSAALGVSRVDLGLAPPEALLPPPPPGPPGAPLDADSLVGLSEAQLLDLFGPATFRRDDEPARLWQYADDRCVLNLFLYPERDVYRVVHAEVRGPTVSRVAADACLGSLAGRLRG